MLGRLIFAAVALACLATIAAVVWLDRARHQVVVDNTTEIIVPRGVTMRSFAQQMVDQQILDEPWSLRLWARYQGLAGALKAGEYRLPAGTTLQALLEQVTSGDVIAYPVTVIEGWTFARMRQALAAENKLQQVTPDMDDQQVMQALGDAERHPEGQFFPDTYHYTAEMSDLDILRQAYDKMQRFLAQQWQQRSQGLPLADPQQALTLASIIEKETGIADERALIAGVFINRLRKNMRLQTDPTVIYGMGEAFDGNIRRRDLLTDTPYNTYTRHGLPPTPIALPGGDSIYAALHPADTDALYFVARGDGSHQFSRTLAEHNAAVLKYQLGGGKNRASNRD
jgi:UPF0755 protein